MLRTRKLREVMPEEDVQCVQQCASMLRRVYRMDISSCLASQSQRHGPMAVARPLFPGRFHRWERLELSCCISLQRLTDPAKGAGCSHRARQTQA